MAKSSFINKKFFVTALLLVILVAGGIGLYYLLKPKADTKLAFSQAYEVTQSEDYSYIKARNQKICDALSSLHTSEDSYSLTKFQFSTYKSINSSLDLQNTLILDNIMFVEEKDGDLVKLQQEMTESFNKLKESISACKTYVDTYLTNSMIDEYTDSQLYLKIYNYKPMYTNYISCLADFYSYIGQVFDGYLYDTISVNPLSRANVLVTTSWAKILTDFVSDYKDEYSEYNFNLAVSKLYNFSNKSKNTGVSEYVNNKAQYDVFANTLSKVNLDNCMTALAKGAYANYVQGLEGDEKTNAESLTNYFLD